MDKEKMAEGRRRAAEERRLEEQQRRDKSESDRIKVAMRQVDQAVIREHEQLKVQLTTFYEELSILSKKTPNGALNKFKLGYLNDTLKKANTLLGATLRPFATFESFSEDELPSTSDAVLMLSHYLKSMARFYTDHSEHADFGIYRWCVKDGEREFEDEAEAEGEDDEDKS